MLNNLIAMLLITGGAFAAIAGIGLLRFPDVLMRMHASTKAGTLGVGLSVISVAIYYADDLVTTKVVLIVLFILLTAPVAEAPATFNACWGQASKVFAQMGEMGSHSANQSNPRAGLRNLARLLYGLGVIGDATLAALGRFVADDLGLSIEACMN